MKRNTKRRWISLIVTMFMVLSSIVVPSVSVAAKEDNLDFIISNVYRLYAIADEDDNSLFLELLKMAVDSEEDLPDVKGLYKKVISKLDGDVDPEIYGISADLIIELAKFAIDQGSDGVDKLEEYLEDDSYYSEFKAALVANGFDTIIENMDLTKTQLQKSFNKAEKLLSTLSFASQQGKKFITKNTKSTNTYGIDQALFDKEYTEAAAVIIGISRENMKATLDIFVDFLNGNSSLKGEVGRFLKRLNLVNDITPSDNNDDDDNGGGGGGGSSSPSKPDKPSSDEVNKDADELGNITNGDQASEKLNEVGKKLDSAISNLNNVKDEKEANKVAKQITKAAAATVKAASKAATEEKDAAKVAKVVENAAKVIEKSVKALDKVSGEEAAAAAKEVIDGAAELLKALKADVTKSKDAAVIAQVTKVVEKLVKVAEKAVEQAGKEKIKDVKVEGKKAVATVTAESAAAKIEKILAAKAAVEKDLVAAGVDTNKKVTAKLTIEVAPVEGDVEVAVDIPTGVLNTAKEKGIDTVEVNTGAARLTVSADTFKEAASTVSLSAKVVAASEVPATVPPKSVVVDLNAFADNQKVSKFKKPIEVAIPYTVTAGDNTDLLTVYLLKDDGTVEAVGGVYDEVTGTVKFVTNHFSKYFAKTATQRVFNDLSAATWAANEISVLASKGYINGVGSGQYDPNAQMTRAQFAQLIVNILKIADDEATAGFADVSSDAWYYNAVASMVSAGYMDGRSASAFEPNEYITREEMAEVVAQILVQKGYKLAEGTTLIGKVTDLTAIDAEAFDAVATAYANGIIQGNPDGTFGPQEGTTRAQSAVMIYRLLNK